MRPIILVCLVAYGIAMEAVIYGSHQFVAAFGAFAAFALIGVAYFTARYFERRR